VIALLLALALLPEVKNDDDAFPRGRTPPDQDLRVNRNEVTRT